MGARIPRWESELWSYVSSSDGAHCPLYSYCQDRQRNGWCPADNINCISRLLDDSLSNVSKYDCWKGREACRVFQLVEMLAQKYLKMGNVRSPPVPVELIALCDKRRAIEVRELPLKVYHGAIWCLKDRWIVHLNANESTTKKRLGLFHEAFHILAHCKATPVFRKTESERGSFNELLADYFAGSLLIPGDWVREKWAQVHDLDRMAEIFDVPQQLVWVRLRELDLI